MRPAKRAQNEPSLFDGWLDRPAAQRGYEEKRGPTVFGDNEQAIPCDPPAQVEEIPPHIDAGKAVRGERAWLRLKERL